mmetsp:Transcript_33338/g.73714  ORF Transcript_33338/g.73714 Transcript_33338/m.73714 type:complete len:99 (-) Transcript_33338:896-1192(-)|eukprot:CAMPEP_0202900768 /NCGR_PEP_ID=MMETSP1392-20130828/12021_1 /ASSEMBLY_ACC=CAM_ASM_000868 /TAXON_ID=225041 /ORGANISM="Chlamydomonas chlamydogama, Strain SAG 11-48b" /LENGTH=98 /DNA_ID=CAMNT_0049587209 /DNA_START=204 /DNA_END=500 /DNA_ORIENTATION=-
MADASQKSAADVMKEQEALLMAKYGGLKPKKKGGLMAQKEHKYFDSADWAMNKEQKAKDGDGAAKEDPKEEVPLKPKLEPTPVPARRISHLDPMDKSM